eukprot:1661177-Ditylum_brightwellii.AAC.1
MQLTMYLQSGENHNVEACDSAGVYFVADFRSKAAHCCVTWSQECRIVWFLNMLHCQYLEQKSCPFLRWCVADHEASCLQSYAEWTCRVAYATCRATIRTATRNYETEMYMRVVMG